MAHMLLVNPLPKKRKRKAGKSKARKIHHKPKRPTVMAKAKRKMKRKAPRSAAQKAATARMLAARGHKTRGKKRRIVRVTSRRSTVQGEPVTPRGRVRSRKRKVKGYSANPLKHKRRKHARRHNPISLKSVPQTVKKVALPVVLGVGASIGLDKLMAKIPVPAALQAVGKENMRTAYLVGIRSVLIIGAMMIGRKFAAKDTVDGAGIGALSVTYTDLARSLMADHLAVTAVVHGYDVMGGYDIPGIQQLGGNADYMAGYDRMGNINSVNAVN